MPLPVETVSLSPHATIRPRRRNEVTPCGEIGAQSQSKIRIVSSGRTERSDDDLVPVVVQKCPRALSRMRRRIRRLKDKFVAAARRTPAEVFGTPTIRKFGASRACARIHASMDVVVVFPCVPRNDERIVSDRNNFKVLRKRTVGILRSTSIDVSGFPLGQRVARTTRSGAGSVASGRSHWSNESQVPQERRSGG